MIDDDQTVTSLLPPDAVKRSMHGTVFSPVHPETTMESPVCDSEHDDCCMLHDLLVLCIPLKPD